MLARISFPFFKGDPYQELFVGALRTKSRQPGPDESGGDADDQGS